MPPYAHDREAPFFLSLMLYGIYLGLHVTLLRLQGIIPVRKYNQS